ncbi:helix-turn-helix domain-containing protein [Novosphingobium sp. FSY-8]|uniref:Helix-turn-helix domain-containing protein n=1 Tax=Novosphingobium ovatum TaxID=1908523 RepID=A0ABW9XBB2_9SPHN|nr:IclR family transcriptional regulator [Novosphingobium ovatum]NBC35830.1 helix-turn-helix domain-containing protein [Novosphingobium ovatum]
MEQEEAATGGQGGAKRRGIQSVEIGLHVLEAVAAMDGPAPLGQIAAACAMPSPQVHRYLQSLIAAGFAHQQADTGRYELGPGALRMGLVALARVDAFHHIDAMLPDLVRRTGLTVQVAALGPMGPTIVRWAMGRPAVMTSFSVGSVLPLAGSATGRVFLAWMPEAETEALIRAEIRRGAVRAAEVAAMRAAVRAAGRAQVEGTMAPGLRAVAFPIFDLQGRVALSATAVRLAAGDDPTGDAATEELGQMCAEISAHLGWREKQDYR